MKKIVLASCNNGKILEIQKFFKNYKVLPYSNICDKFEIEENGSSFQENAIIKAKAVWNKIEETKDVIVLADDSGITVPALNNEPGIYSARYARVGASDVENMNLLVSNLKKKQLKKTEAFYTAAIAIIKNGEVFTTHGFMRGFVVDSPKGYNGFGYDPIFMPLNFSKTLGELDSYVKEELSHRSRALELIRVFL